MRFAHLLALLIVVTLGVVSAAAQQDVYLLQDPSVAMTAGNDACACGGGSSCAVCPASCSEFRCAPSQCGRVFASMEYLNWRATRAATPYAGTLERPTGTVDGLPVVTGTSLITELHDTRYSRNGAFRANIGYLMRNNWDIGFRYTHFDTSGTSSLGDPDLDTNSVLVNRHDRNMANVILDASFDDGEADFASQRIALKLNTYDIEIRRPLRLDSKRLAVRVMGGVRFADIDQTSAISYLNNQGGSQLRADVDEAIGMNATGLLAGAEAHCLLGWNTSVFARGSVSLLLADFSASRSDLQTSSTQAGLRSISSSIQDVVPVAELDVGVRWQRERFYVAIGYDVATWFNMVQEIDAIFQDDVDGATNGYRVVRGDLSFDGLFAEAGVSF